MSTGYGMCGSINTYSSSARVGNWVEDRIGSELAEKQRDPRHNKITYSTVTRESYKLLTDASGLPDANVPILNARQIEEKNKGVPIDLLFSHVLNVKHEDKLRAERFRTESQSKFSSNAFGFTAPAVGQEKVQSRRTDLAREQASVGNYTTTTSVMAVRAGKRMNN